MIYDGSTKSGVNASETGKTGEAASHGKCPTGWQGGPGRHPAAARMKWNRDMNIAVIEATIRVNQLMKVADQSKDIDRECMLFGRGLPSRDYVIRLGRLERMSGLPLSSWMKSGEE